MSGTEEFTVIDCTDRKLGKVLLETSVLIRGLDSVQYHPARVKLQGHRVKLTNVSKLLPFDPYRKVYYHTRYSKGFKVRFARDFFQRDPERYLKRALRGYLPKNKSRNYLLKRVRVSV